MIVMSNTTQPGTEIDESVWEEFRQYVKSCNGQIRGNLKRELENAIKQYMNADESPAERQILAGIRRIENELGTGSTDGGAPPTPTPSEPENTHTDREVNFTGIENKPSAKSARKSKVQWLAQQIENREGKINLTQPKELPKKRIREVVTEEYDFREDTVDDYVDRLIDHIGLVDHPFASGPDVKNEILCTPARREELLSDDEDDGGDDQDVSVDDVFPDDY